MELCPEIMGKVNVFGSIDEITDLVKDTGCGFCIDFAHVLARYGEHKFEDIKKAFPQKNGMLISLELNITRKANETIN